MSKIKARLKTIEKRKPNQSNPKPKNCDDFISKQFKGYFILPTSYHFYLDSNFIGVFSAKNLYPIVKSDSFCFLIENGNDYLYVNVSQMQVYLIQRDGFQSQTFDDKFLSFLKHLSSTRTLYANPPSLDKKTDCLHFCILFHHSLESNNCFHHTCSQLNLL